MMFVKSYNDMTFPTWVKADNDFFNYRCLSFLIYIIDTDYDHNLYVLSNGIRL